MTNVLRLTVIDQMLLLWTARSAAPLGCYRTSLGSGVIVCLYTAESGSLCGLSSVLDWKQDTELCVSSNLTSIFIEFQEKNNTKQNESIDAPVTFLWLCCVYVQKTYL